MAPTELMRVEGSPATILDTDVPWPRPSVEIDSAWTAIVQRLAPARERQRAGDPRLTGTERFLLGAHAAALWSRAEREATPVARLAGPVTGQRVRDELAEASRVMEARAERWEYAAGVVMWLMWVTGATDDRP